MHKAASNWPLTDRQKRANKLIGTKRYIVEQCFETMKRQFGMARVRYFSIHKVNAQELLKGISMNLLKVGQQDHVRTILMQPY
jgi:transposase, IS5 family